MKLSGWPTPIRVVGEYNGITTPPLMYITLCSLEEGRNANERQGKMCLEILAGPLMDAIHVHILLWLHDFWELSQILQLMQAAKTCFYVMAAPWGGCCNICKSF